MYLALTNDDNFFFFFSIKFYKGFVHIYPTFSIRKKSENKIASCEESYRLLIGRKYRKIFK